MNAIPLNVFQRLIRTWEAAHPYNAAQAMRIRGQLKLDEVQPAWDAALRGLGLGTVSFRGGSLSHHLLNGRPQSHAVTLVEDGRPLETYLGDEIDRPFDDPHGSPFRPFLLVNPESSWFGVCYRHCVADSASIRLVLEAWFARWANSPVPRPRPVVHESDGYWRLFAGRNGKVRLDESFMTAVRGRMRLRRVLKPRTTGEQDYPSRVLLTQAPDGLICRLRADCRRSGVRVSDVMLAALAEVARTYVPLQRRPTRRDLAIGCVVDLRPHADRSMDRRFGLFLGFTSVICRPRDFADPAILLRSVRRQTQLHRQRGIAASSTAWMSAAILTSPFIAASRVYHFYRKQMPLAAGLSSVNLDRDWPIAHYPSPLMQYVRVSPTGPMAPVVLSATSLGSQWTMALTYRPAVVTRQAAAAMMEAFIERLSRVDKALLT